jgi:hypothetical protein
LQKKKLLSSSLVLYLKKWMSRWNNELIFFSFRDFKFYFLYTIFIYTILCVSEQSPITITSLPWPDREREKEREEANDRSQSENIWKQKRKHSVKVECRKCLFYFYYTTIHIIIRRHFWNCYHCYASDKFNLNLVLLFSRLIFN